MNTRLTRRKMLMTGSALAATTLLAACGAADDEDGNGQGNDADPSVTPTSTPSPQGTLVPDPIEHPEGEDELMLRIEQQGGFVPWEYVLTGMPNASLFGDGRLIIPGPQPEIYPPPALPNLLVTKLNSEGMQTILARAEVAGLLAGDQTYDDFINRITDAPTNVFTTNAGGQTSTVSVYALGLDGDLSTLPPERQEIYEALASFAEFVQSAPTSMPGSSIDVPEAPYEIQRLQLISQPAAAEEVPGDPEVGSQELAWPLDVPLSELGDPYAMPDSRCFVVEGEQLVTMLSALEGANSLTRWTSNGQLYTVFVRPLLPDEAGCPPLDAPAPGPAGYEHPINPDEVIARIEIQGGFVPIQWWATNLPVVSLMGDGSLVSQGPQIMIYPPPALPSLVRTKLNEDGIQAILQEAETAGLLGGDRNYNMIDVTDVETTVFTVTANGKTHTVSVYGLSVGDGAVDVPEEEREARARLAQFMNLMTGVAAWLPPEAIAEPEAPYQVQRLQIASQPETLAPLGDESVVPGEAEWPLATPLAELGDPFFLEMSRCFMVEGEELATLMPALQQANTLTRWISNGERFVIYLRPLMPDESACVDPFA